MTYISNHCLAFRDDSTPATLIRTRSEGRLKEYPSTTDARAWRNRTEERRQYILELVSANHEKASVGKFVPIEAILRCLLSHKDEIIARLQRELDECRARSGMSGTSGTSGMSGPSGISGMSGPSGMSGMSRDQKANCGDSAKKPCPKKTGKLAISSSDYPDSDAATSSATTSVFQNKAPGTLEEKLKDKERECEYYQTTAREAVLQLEKLHNIVGERDSLKQELEAIKHRIKDPCAEEIASLEQEITRLRSANRLSTEEEAAVMQKEVEILKKYCNKINKIQVDNYQLQTQLNRLQELSDIPTSQEDEPELPNDPAELKTRLKELKKKFAKLNDIMDERDKLRLRCTQLQGELSKYENLPEEVEDFKRRSGMLDFIVEERDDLRKRLENMKSLENEIIELKKKADRAKELEMKLAQLNVEVGQVRRQSASELKSLQQENKKMSRDVARAKSDIIRRDSDIATASGEIERLQYTAKETEMIKLERDRLKLKLDELAGGDIDYMSDQCRCLHSIKAERDMYKAKYEDLIGLECECDMLRVQVENHQDLGSAHEELLEQLKESDICITDQENEIQKLVSEIERLSIESQEQQARMQQTINDLRAELDERNCLIAGSKEQLAGVEDNLRDTIENISSETLHLRNRIDELVQELEASQERIAMLESKLKELEIDVDLKDDQIRSLSQDLTEDRKNSIQLEDSVKGMDEIISELKNQINIMKAENAQLVNMVNEGFEKDEHLERILKQSKCAVKRVAELL